MPEHTSVRRIFVQNWPSLIGGESFWKPKAIDPVALGLCKQSELDAAVQKANAKKAKEGGVMSDDERRKLVSTEQSLGMDTEPKIPAAMAGLETFTLGDAAPEPEEDTSVPDADTFFNLPDDDGDDDED